MHTAVVTGISGFIGGYIAREFLQGGWRVIGMMNRREPAWSVPGMPLSLVRADLTRPAEAVDRLNQAVGANIIDALVHCAARVTDVGRDKRFRTINYDAVRVLVDWSAVHCRRLVYISTTDVYGFRDCSGESEDDIPLATGRINPYPKYKILSEEYIRRRLSRHSRVILRPGSVWGLGDHLVGPRITEFLRSSRYIVCFGRHRGGNRWPLSHVRNVAAAAFLASVDEESAGRAITVIDSERSDVRSVFRMFASIYCPDRQYGILCLPCLPVYPVTLINSWFGRFFDLDRPLFDPTPYTLRTASCDRDYSNARFVTLMRRHGRDPFTREEGIRELMEEQ